MVELHRSNQTISTVLTISTISTFSTSSIDEVAKSISEFNVEGSVMSGSLEFNYDRLDPKLSMLVRERTCEIRRLLRRSVQDIVTIGQKLIEVKSHLGHGYFGNWLATEFQWNERTAQHFMNVARRFKSEIISELRIDAAGLYALASPNVPEAAREDAIARAAKGEHITGPIARQIIETYLRLEDDLSGKSRNTTTNAADQDQSDTQLAQPLLSESLRRLVKKGRIGAVVAQEIVRTMQEYGEPVREIVQRWGISDPSLLPMLERLSKRKSETFQVIYQTGHIPSPDESVSIWEATHRDLRRYLNEASFEYKMAAIQRRQEQREYERRERLSEFCRGSSTELIITDSLAELNKGADRRLVFFVPGDLQQDVVLKAVERKGYRLLGLVLSRGDPLINVGGKIVNASDSHHYLGDAAELLMISLGNLKGAARTASDITVKRDSLPLETGGDR